MSSAALSIDFRHAIVAGASRNQRAETGLMAMLMHGDPAFTYLVPLFKASRYSIV